MMGGWLRVISKQFAKSALLRTLVLCATMTVPAGSALAQDQCAAYEHGHYGTFGEPVTDRGPLNRGPLIFDTPQAAVAAAAAWVTLLDGPVCGAARAWYVGAVLEQGPTGTLYDMLGDVYAPGCSGVTKGARIGHVNCWHAQDLVLQLVAPLETRPADTGGVSEITLTARVTDGVNSKPGVSLGFTVDVTPYSGSHEHHSAARPKGTLSAVQSKTDANGEVKLTFKAPEAAGIHTVKAICAACSNSSVSKEIQVKVPNLVEMLPDTARPETYTLVGATGNHKSNHWFTPASVVTLGKVTDAMFKTGWGTVGINDGSLAWGGLFDIAGGWKASHIEHRVGTEVDISVNNPLKISDEQKKKTYAELCKKDNSAFSSQTLWHKDDGYPEHFHIYLDGNGLTDQAGGGPCCARYKTTRPKVDKNGKPVLDKNGKPVQETVALCEETTPR